MISDSELFSGVIPFFHTAEARSFRRAAQKLGITPAAISKAVMKLEETVGVKLLSRTSRTVSLTPEGAVFLERCREAIASLQAGHQALSEAQQMPRGDIHVSLPFILGRVVTSALPKMASRYPDLSYRLSMTNRFVNLVEENVDVAVRVGVLEDSSLVVRSLAETQWVTVASPSFVARHGRPRQPDDLTNFDALVFVTEEGRLRMPVFRDPKTDEQIVGQPRVRLRVNQGEEMLDGAMSGLGICQLLDFMVQKPLQEGRLVEVLEGHRADGPMIQALTTRERSKTPNVRAFLSFLVDAFAHLST
ncbi:MAG: LysR family transcriptional regulator [Deltaproteobacteria bacterium]|nr:LysR family transcriptional regulator [Deltaproteobacteria bacterium]